LVVLASKRMAPKQRSAPSPVLETNEEQRL